MKVVLEQDFDAVGRSAWEQLTTSSSPATVFQSWGWHRAWWRAYHDHAERELFLVCVWDEVGGQLTAVAPLFVERSGGRRTLRFIGDGRSGSMDLICADGAPESRSAILDWLKEHDELWQAIELNQLPGAGPTTGLVADWARSHRLSVSSRSGAAVGVLSLREGADSTSADFETAHSTDARSIAADLSPFFIQHIHRWSSDKVQSHFLERATRDFYRYLTDELRGDGELLLTTLRRNGTAVAFAFGASTGDKMLWCDASSDVLEASGHPEDELLREVMRFGRARGFEELVLSRDTPATRGLGALVTRKGQSVRVSKEHPSAIGQFVSTSKVARRALAVAGELQQAASAALNARRIVDERRKRASAQASHQDFYDAGYNTRQYLREIRLQKPEQVILAELRPAMKTMRVLDVGVGAGRTVPYFGTAAHEYSGFDFAPNMVAACQAITGDIVDPANITTGDARHMTAVADASCDLVLISYNAIDDIGGEADRFKVLAEVRRVVTPDGYFCFSSHNMRSLTPAGATGLVPRLRRWRRFRLLRAANPGLSNSRHAATGMIHDPGMDYRFPHYYIAPSAQAKQLKDFGFSDVRVFSVDTGQEIVDPTRWDDLVDSWVYYLCRARSE